MTPTEQDKELREQVESILHLNGCQQRTHGYNEALAGKDIDMEEMERFEQTTLDEIMQLITADRKRVALEARINERNKIALDEVMEIVQAHTNAEIAKVLDRLEQADAKLTDGRHLELDIPSWVEAERAKLKERDDE